MEKNKILEHKGHRPVGFPEGHWVMQQTWEDVLFIHYKVSQSKLRKAVPKGLTLDTFNGDTWITISPLKMRNVKLRLMPPVPTAYNFLELNLRTYVNMNGKPGIYFFSLDTSSILTTIGARLSALPYFNAVMKTNKKEKFNFSSSRIGKSKTPAEFEANYLPVSNTYTCEKGSLDYWLLERYCLFQQKINGDYIEIDIHHLPWQINDVDAEINNNTLLEPFELELEDQNPAFHYSKKQDVLVWPPKKIGSSNINI